MSSTESMTLIISADNRDEANTYFESTGWGAEVLSVPLSPNGALPITHYGAHTYETVEEVATLIAARDSDDPTLDGINNLFIKSITSTSPTFQDVIQSQDVLDAFGSTLSIYYPPIEM